MAAKWIELVTGSLEQKKEYRACQARIKALPEPYSTVAKAVDRYFMSTGNITLDGDAMTTMWHDFADLWERAAADKTPVRDIVGDDPVEFAEMFAEAYTGKRWIDKARRRLVDEIDAVAGKPQSDNVSDSSAAESSTSDSSTSEGGASGTEARS